MVGPGWLHCRLKNVSYCWYSFYHMQGVVIMDTSHQECPVITQPDYAGIVIGKHVQYTHFCLTLRILFSGLVGVIVAVGMLTILLWKVFTTITDRREFARFEKETHKIRFNANSNPIFKQATTTIMNPVYSKEDF